MAKILLVEDSLDLSRIITRELERNGYSILAEQNGEDALVVFQSEHPDLIVLDWMLGGISGLDVLREIRISSNVPVLMLTARSDLADRVAGLELGADDYLVKPFELPELLARIHALLRRAMLDQQMLSQGRMKENQSLSWRGIILSSLEHSCKCDNVPVELTRLEFDLLELLMQNPGRVFTRTSCMKRSGINRFLKETVRSTTPSCVCEKKLAVTVNTWKPSVKWDIV